MKIIEKIKTLPHKPGCYLYLNVDENIIYVGKAKDLYKRVGSYFNRAQNYKTTKLVNEIVDVKFIVCQSEYEALILEQNLIKKYRPKYNIVLNDDKAYPYIVITNDNDPAYDYVRKYNKKYLRAYGPFPDGSSALKILQILKRLYPLKACKNKSNSPCLYYHLNMCSGACFKDVDKLYYEDMIDKVDYFFNNSAKYVIDQLKEKMYQLSDNQQYEQAKKVLDLINNIPLAVDEHQSIDLHKNSNIDVFSYSIENDLVCFSVSFYRLGQLMLTDHCVNYFDNNNFQELFNNFFGQIYEKNNNKVQILIDPDLKLEEQFHNLSLRSSNSKQAKELLAFTKQNASELLKQHLKESLFKKSKQELLKNLQQITNIKKFPTHIEMFDIANIGNAFISGGVIKLINGEFVLNEFRKYKIDPNLTNDFDRMNYLICKRYSNNKYCLPDLLIVDGGKQQVSAAKLALKQISKNCEIIGLAKDDHHRTDYIVLCDHQTVEIKKDKQLYYFLANIQQRVHDYTISFFKQRQIRNVTNDELENVKGVNKTLIKKINQVFLDRNDFWNSSLDEKKAIIKDEKVLKNILDYYSKIK